jgi:hypothetical protein
MAGSVEIGIEFESGVFTGTTSFRDSWGFERSWWAQDEASEPAACCPGWQL